MLTLPASRVLVASSVLLCAPGALLAAPEGSSGGSRPSIGASAAIGPEEKTALAKAHFQRGIELFEKAEFAGALAEFQSSLGVSPTRSALVNAALCLRHLGRFDESLELLETVPSRFGVSAEEEREYQSELSDLSERTGAIELRRVPVPSRVLIDGRDRGDPNRVIRVLVGRRHVRIEVPDRDPLETIVEVAAGHRLVLEVSLGPSGDASSGLQPSIHEQREERPPLSPPQDERPIWSIALGGGPAISSTLGGDVASCSSACDAGAAVGGRITASLGRDLGPRWRLRGELGYLSMSQTIRDRPAAVSTTDQKDDPGLASDSLRLRGAFLGASTAYRPRWALPSALRVGVGALLARMDDRRDGTFVEQPSVGSATTPSQYRIDESSWSWATYAVLSVAAEAGFHPVPRFYMGAGLEWWIAGAIHRPVWRRATPDFPVHGAGGWFSSESLAGSAFWVLFPFLEARYDFSL